jgi:hypothetical protein
VASLSAKENQSLAEEFSFEATRILQERSRRETLAGFGLPRVEVDFDPGGIDQGALFGIAEQLSKQLSTEVG